MEGAESASERIKARHSRANVKKGSVVKQRDGTTILSESLGTTRASKALQRVADAMATLDSTKVRSLNLRYLSPCGSFVCARGASGTISLGSSNTCILVYAGHHHR